MFKTETDFFSGISWRLYGQAEDVRAEVREAEEARRRYLGQGKQRNRKSHSVAGITWFFFYVAF